MTPAHSSDAGAWGGPATLSAWDTVMWRAEGSARTTSTGLLVELLDSEPDPSRFIEVHREAVARIPRLREHVVEAPIPVAPPRWSPDPRFNLDYHVREVDLGGFATTHDLMSYCESDWQEALDWTRPPWQATLIRGLAGNKAAYLFKCHHSLTDGMGLVQLMDLTHHDGPSEPLRTARARPVRRTVTPTELLVRGLTDRAITAPSAVRSTASRIRRKLAAPRTSLDQAVRYSRSLGRLLGAMPARSPLLSSGGAQNRLLMLDIDLDALKRAGRAAGGSVNDAYVSAILGGLRHYHERHNVYVDKIPIGMPVSLRSASDPAGGNRFAGVRFAAPLSETDPAARIRLIGEFVRNVRTEPAISYLDSVSEALRRLPRPALIEVTGRAVAAADLQISNIPGLRRPAYLAGARVVGTYPFGPRPGVAGMVTLMTLQGHCCIGLNVDATTFPDIEVLYDCLEAGLAEVLQLAESATRENECAP